MKKYNDFSVHFSPKEQNLKDIENKFDSFLEESESLHLSTETDPETVFHHCFLPEEVAKEKQLSQEIFDTIDFLDTICEEQARWYGVGMTLANSRSLMLQNLKRVGGLAIFIGDLKGGVKEEYETAKRYEVDVVHIP